VKEEITNVSDTRLSIAYAFDSDEIAAESESVIGEFCKEVNFPGFRKGKVPKNIVLAKFSEGIDRQLKANITQKAIKSLEKKDEQWSIVSIVNISHDNTPEGMACTLTVDIIPQFELPDYKNISLGPLEMTIAEQEVDNAVKSVLKQSARYVPVDREAKAGDYVRLNYCGQLDSGENVAAIGTIPTIYGTQSNTWEEAGNTISPGVHAIVEGIIGTKAGDRKTVSQKFDEEFAIPELRGQNVTYDLEIIEVRECILPELTDDFLQTLSVKSESELHERTRDLMVNHKISQGRIKQREELIGKLVEGTSIKIPQSSIDEEDVLMLNEFANQQIKSGANSGEIERYSQNILDAFRPAAEVRKKLSAILDKIAEKENIRISNADFENAILQNIHAQKLDANKYIAELKHDTRKLSDLRMRILRGKTLDHLLSMITKDPGVQESNAPGGDPQSIEIPAE
jgi:trigger factor